jgi:hypothetical protein
MMTQTSRRRRYFFTSNRAQTLDRYVCTSVSKKRGLDSSGTLESADTSKRRKTKIVAHGIKASRSKGERGLAERARDVVHPMQYIVGDGEEVPILQRDEPDNFADYIGVIKDLVPTITTELSRLVQQGSMKIDFPTPRTTTLYILRGGDGNTPEKTSLLGVCVRLFDPTMEVLTKGYTGMMVHLCAWGSEKSFGTLSGFCNSALQVR